MNRFLRLAVSAALVTLVAWNTDWQSVAKGFANLRWGYWLSAVALLFATQFVSAKRWQMLARALGLSCSFSDITGYYFIGMFFSLVLPTSVGGDVVRAFYLTGRSEKKLPAFVSVLFDRLNGLVVLMVLASISAIVLHANLPWWVPLFVWITTASMLIAVALMPWLARFGKHGHVRVQQVRAMMQLLRQPKLLVQTSLLSLFIQVANIIILWLVGLALQADVPPSYYWVLVPMVSVLTLLPSVNGMGVREYGMVRLLAPVGVAETPAVTLALLWFAVNVSVSLTGGLAYLSGRFTRVPTLSEDGADHGPVDHHSDQGRTRQLDQAA